MWTLLTKCCALLAAVVVLGLGGAAEAKIKVAFVTSESGMGDRSFNDMMDQGMKRAVKDLDIDYVIIQPRSILGIPAVARLVRPREASSIIIGSSFDMIKPMQAVAASFPNQKFDSVDVGPEPIAPNVVSRRDQGLEGSFLVGVIAAKVSKTGTIGFVGGKDILIIHRFFVGRRRLRIDDGEAGGQGARRAVPGHVHRPGRRQGIRRLALVKTKGRTSTSPWPGATSLASSTWPRPRTPSP